MSDLLLTAHRRSCVKLQGEKTRFLETHPWQQWNKLVYENGLANAECRDCKLSSI